MNINELRRDNELINLFCELVEIPSPSMQEEQVIEKILEIFKNENIEAKTDDYGNVIANIPATDKNKSPILLSAHLDVIGDNSPINIKLDNEKKCIETDKTRTLGADDKCGVSCAIQLAKDISKAKNFSHGGLEIVFTRDEEYGLSGIHHLDPTKLCSEHVLVLDADTLGQILVSGSGYTNFKLSVYTVYGGHSGIDIHDEKRLNAAKLIADLITKIPQGVYKKNGTDTITSINLGSIVAGAVDSGINKLTRISEIKASKAELVSDNSATNIINTSAYAQYSIRSAEKETEEKLINELKEIIANFNNHYEGLANAQIKISQHLPIFEKSNNDCLPEIAKQAAIENEIHYKVGSFHAGAETHIYKHLRNASGKTFEPLLIGVSTIHNMHAATEQVEIESLLKGYNFLKSIFTLYNK